MSRIIHITEHPGRGRLGRHIEHDPRSRAFEVTTRSSPLVSASWTRHVAPFDQGDLGSCTGNAMAGVLGTAPFTCAHPVDEDLAVRIYASGTHLDYIAGHYPPDDTGSSGLAVAKAAFKMGLISAYHHCFSLNSALATLGHVGPVIIGINWYEGFDAPQGVEARLEIAGDIRGGHEVELLAVDVDKQLVRGVNSWGSGWGDGGYFTMSFDTFGQLLSERGDVVVPLR